MVFNLTPPLSICKTVACSWKENVLYNFNGGSDGYGLGGLVWDQQANLYASRPYGGSADYGVVDQFTKVGNSWTATPIHTFTGQPDGARPNKDLITDSSGNIFGTTSSGGLYGLGTVCELSYVGGQWVETILYNFENNTDCDGECPAAGVTMDSAGNLYGTAATSSSPNCSGWSVFELARSGESYT